MMKKTFLLIFLLPPLFSTSQQQPVIWYFGYFGGVDFTSGSPVPLTNSAMATWEGVATACDSSGNLLFYSDGISVWNKNNLLMTNGTGLMGAYSSTQSATIVPKPGNANQYYLFTCPEVNGGMGFRYSIIDMSLNGGLGDVTVTKNILLTDTAGESCVSLPSCNGFVWIVTGGPGGIWLSYLIDTSGINTPVISSAGLNLGKNVGYMKASPLNNKIAVAHYALLGSNSFFQLFDFNDSSGILSNAFELSIDTSVYGCEFSPDGSKFYGAEWTINSKIFQFDLTSGSQANIAASQTLIGACSEPNVGDLQIGPDQKIYIAVDHVGYLSVIDSPNNLGTACHFLNHSIYLNGYNSAIGLPPKEIFATYQPCHSGTEFTPELIIDKNISIYPNPSSGNFTVELLQSENSGEVSIDVVNTLGQKVFSSQQKISAADFKMQIDLSNVARGIYFIEIKTTSNFLRKKIVIVKHP